jgi:hypothetical protein
VSLIFKLIEIQQQKSQGLFVAVRALCFFFKLVVKMPEIVKLGEVVDYAQFPVSLFALP